MAARPNMQLSLGDDGQVVDPMADMLGFMESVEVDLSRSLSLKDAREEEQPSGDVMTDGRRDQLVKEAIKISGGKVEDAA
jgi:hypothetical protein